MGFEGNVSRTHLLLHQPVKVILEFSFAHCGFLTPWLPISIFIFLDWKNSYHMCHGIYQYFTTTDWNFGLYTRVQKHYLTKLSYASTIYISFLHTFCSYNQSDRLQKVLEYVNQVHCLCGVLGLDFTETVHQVHPSLHRSGGPNQSTNISNSTIDGLSHVVLRLKEERKQRIQKVIFILLLFYFGNFWVFLYKPELNIHLVENWKPHLCDHKI